ncbi:MAG: TonB-dependent receptor [Acidobacteria bacterium]|nr:TonB-dependent receptor [Acidobacteriota bacterium]
MRKALAVLLLATAPLVAQIGGGSLIGYVTDPTGAAVAGAQVRATNQATSVPVETRTNELGYYEFPLLAAAQYRLEAEARGFQKALSAVFELNSGTRPRVDLKLVLGQVSESVEVAAAPPLVNVSTTDLGVVIDKNKVDALPLNGRNFAQLVGLQAGVLVSPPGGAGGRGGIEFHGSPSQGNNLLLDGVDMSFGENNGTAGDTASAGAAGSLVNTVSVEAIQEFKATGSAFAAEYGRASGGVLNITTKSGTNALHGTLFEFLRNDKLDANSFFNNRSGLSKPPLRWNQFGGNLGGPIFRDKLFFFFNYEGAVVRRNQQVTGNVPTPLLISQVNPAIRQALAYLPLDSEPTTNPQIGFHRRNDRRKNDEVTTLSRGDWNISPQNRLSLRFSYNNQDFTTPLLTPTLSRLFPLRFHNALVQDTHTLSPTMFNELRLGFNRVDLFRYEPGREAVPAWINVAGVGISLPLVSYIRFISTTYTLADNFTVVRGKHTIKAGFEIRQVRSVRDQGGQPTHMYNNLADLIADRSNRIQVLFGGGKGLRNWNNGFFVQDDWRITPRFQLNAGIRYEYFPPLTGGFGFATSDPYGPFNTAGSPMFAADRNNFGPRLGFVWDALGNQKLVVRAGTGVSYVPTVPMVYYDQAFIDPRLPFVATLAPTDIVGTSTAYPFPQSYIDRIVANPNSFPSNLVVTRRGNDFNSRTEYAGQWNYSMQYQVKPTLAVQASYVGSRALKLFTARTLNLVDPRLGRRPRTDLADVIIAENSLRSWYHGLQLSANQRMGKGLTLDVYYTFAKTMGYGAPDSTLTFDGEVQDGEFNIAGSRGPKQSDLRHRWVMVHSYAVPAPFARNGFLKAAFAGWQLQGIMSARSGFPVNIVSGIDSFGNGRVAGQRTDLVQGQTQYVKDNNTLVWLNTAAFDNNGPRLQRRFGNLGYNALRAPTAFNYDAALHKQFLITERHRLTFRFEMFNALNHRNLGGPTSSVANPNFGRILSASDGRNIQFALKYQF